MKIEKLKITILMCLVLTLSGQAQTAKWLVEPTYQSIEPYSEALFKVKTYNDMALVNTKGEIVLKADSITYLTNGFALGLTFSDGKYLLSYIIDGKGEIIKPSQEMYIGDYPFFSEDKCPVMNKKGKYGYITPDGKLVIPYTYVAIHPFREGLASVVKAKKGVKGLLGAAANLVSSDNKIPPGASVYIDTKGVVQKFPSEIGVAIMATSFRNGKAFVQNDANKSFIIDKRCKIIETEPDISNLKRDDYYALAENEISEVDKPYRLSYNSAYSLFTENGLLGYMLNGTTMLPSQFQKASGFANGLSVVKVDDKFGILQQIGGTTNVTVTENEGKLEVAGTLPADWDGHKATFVRIVNGTDKLSFAMNGEDGNRSLSTDVPKADGGRIYEVEVDGLTIWRLNKIEYGMDESKDNKKNPRNGISVRAPSLVKANAKGECVINVRVTNNTKSAQTIMVMLSIGGSKSISLGAGKTGSVKLSTKIVKEFKCTITGKCPGGSSSCTTTLKPSFVL